MRSPAAVPLALIAATLAVGSPAPATTAEPASERVVAKSFAPPGSLDDGHLALKAALDADDGASGSSLPGQRYPWAIPRTSTDRPDEKTGRLLHVVYLLPAAAPDDRYDEKGILEDSMRSMNAWTRQQTGNTKQWRLDTFTFQWDDPATTVIERISVNAVDVTFIRSAKSDDALDSVSEVEGELRAKGFGQSNKRYLSYVASNAGGVCGDAWYTYIPSQDSFDGKYSDIYLYSSTGCRAREFAPNATTPGYTESIAMQEMVHNDGMVPMTAPRNCLVSLLAFGHVCTAVLWASPNLDPESTDVLFPYVGLPLSQKKLDEDHLDYYGHPNPAVRDLDQGLYLESV